MDDLECFCSNTAIHSLQHCSTAALITISAALYWDILHSTFCAKEFALGGGQVIKGLEPSCSRMGAAWCSMVQHITPWYSISVWADCTGWDLAVKTMKKGGLCMGVWIVNSCWTAVDLASESLGAESFVTVTQVKLPSSLSRRNTPTVKKARSERDSARRKMS